MDIDCGTATGLGVRKHSLFWPVSKVVPLAVDWHPPQGEKFFIIFTSQNAVQIFLSQIYSLTNEQKWKQCAGIGAVGLKTAQFAESRLFRFKEILYPQHENGLLPLLMLLKNKLLGEVKYVIFTAENGKTVQTLELFEKRHPIASEIVPLYRLEENDNEINRVFLEKLFKGMDPVVKPRDDSAQSRSEEFFFHCYSGMLLTQTLSALARYFNVSKPDDLPSFISFSVWEKSAKETMQKLNRIDR